MIVMANISDKQGQKLVNRQHKSDHSSTKPKVNSTAAYQHSAKTGHTFKYEETKILKTEKHLQKRLTLEAIYINQNSKTAINLKSDIDTLNPSYSKLLNINIL